jgi:hypothetical protein
LYKEKPFASFSIQQQQTLLLYSLFKLP